MRSAAGTWPTDWLGVSFQRRWHPSLPYSHVTRPSGAADLEAVVGPNDNADLGPAAISAEDELRAGTGRRSRNGRGGGARHCLGGEWRMSR